MPLSELSAPPFRTSRRLMRGIISPLDPQGDDNPAFNDPSYADNDPEPIVEPHELDTPTASSISDPAPKNGNYSGLKAAAKPMPPPGLIAPPPPPAPQSAIPPPSAQLSTPPVSKFPPPPAATARLPLGVVDTQPAGAHPTQKVPPPVDDSDLDPIAAAGKSVEDIRADRPERPKSNWAQRLGLAVLSMSRFAPIANQLMHPKWAEQEAGYQAQLVGAQGHLKDVETQTAAEASAALKEASAAQKTAQGEMQGQIADTRKYSADTRNQESWRKTIPPTAVQVNDPTQVPVGQTLRTNPFNPQEMYAVPNPYVDVPPEMQEFFPGQKQVPARDYDAGLKAKWQRDTAAQNQANKPDKTDPATKATAIKAGVNLEDIDSWTQPQAAAFLDEKAKYAQQIHVHTPGATAPPAISVPGSSADQQLRTEAANHPELDNDAWTYLLENKLTLAGRGGKEAFAQGQKIKARGGQIMQDLGLDPSEVRARRSELSANLPALKKVTSYDAMIGAFEGTLQRNAQTAKTLSDQFQRGDVRLYNRVLSAFKTGVGDTEALNLAAQLHGLAREWGKIMQGSVGTAGVPISEANAADEFFTKGLSNGQLGSLIDDVIIPDAKNRRAANDAEKQRLLGGIRGLSGPQGATPPPSGGGMIPVTIPARNGQPAKTKYFRDQQSADGFKKEMGIQ